MEDFENISITRSPNKMGMQTGCTIHNNKTKIHIDEFPDEILLHIFSFLPLQDVIQNVRYTCPSFHNVSYDRSLTNTMHIKDLTNLDHPDKCQLIRDSRSLTHFYFDSRHRVQPSLLDYLSKNAPNLQSLHIKHCSLSKSRPIEKFFTHCKTLKELSFDSMSTIAYPEVIAKPICLQGMQFLETIRLKGCSYLDDDVLIRIADSCINLKNITLYQLARITDKSVSHVLRVRGPFLRGFSVDCINLNYSLKELVCCTSLEKLKLYSWPYASLRHPDNLPAQSKLQSLLFELCYFSDSYTASILDRYPNLSELSLKDSKHTSKVTVQSIIKNTNLRKLKINSCQFDPTDLSLIFGKCRKVYDLEMSLSNIEHLTDSQICSIFQRVPIIKFGEVDSDEKKKVKQFSAKLENTAVFIRNYSYWKRISVRRRSLNN